MRDLELMPLLSQTPTEWVKVAISQFDEFLLDHAACERKASALAMSFVVKYPDRKALIEPMIALAREELAHFHEVYLLLAKRGLIMGPDHKDPYMKQLLPHTRHGREEYFLDRLLISGVVEARGCERFHLVGEALQDEELARYYHGLAKAEAGHYKIFFNIADQYFTKEIIHQRLDELLQIEADIVASLPLRAAVH